VLIVDDHIARSTFSGFRPRRWGGDIPAITWGLHFRLLRALMDPSTSGKLSGGAHEGVLAAALDPPPEVLSVLDPRPFTELAARLKIDYRLTNIGAELLAAAIETKAHVHIAAINVAPNWEAALGGSGVELVLYDQGEIA